MRLQDFVGKVCWLILVMIFFIALLLMLVFTHPKHAN